MNINQRLLQPYSLKWNPFVADIPNDALISSKEIESFCWRTENLVMDGGWASIVGESGLGKSVALRILANRLGQMREVKIGIIARPQSGIVDFYREMGHLFEIDFKTSNRWGGYRSLRDKWLHHIQSTLFRPILLIDEAQEARSEVLNELRFLASMNFDSKMILTVVLCGDNRLPDKFKQPDLLPLWSRIRIKMHMRPANKDELIRILNESMCRAGNSNLMTPELVSALANHSSGNYRVMMNMASELLAVAANKELKQIDEGLFFEVFNYANKVKSKKL